jgi:hypothetical protein
MSSNGSIPRTTAQAAKVGSTITFTVGGHAGDRDGAPFRPLEGAAEKQSCLYKPRARSPSARICRTRGGATRYGSSIVAIITGPTTASAPSNAMSPVIPINGRIPASTASSGNCSNSSAPMHAAPIPERHELCPDRHAMVAQQPVA